MKQAFSRRDFFKKCALTLPGLTGLSFLGTGCENNTAVDNPQTKSPPNSPDSANCDDLSALTKAELEARKKLNYEDVATDKTRICNVCALYIEPPQGGECGHCTLVKGPIKPGGTCAYFAPKQS